MAAAEVSNVATEDVAAISLIKGFTIEDCESMRFTRYVSQGRDDSVSAGELQAQITPVVTFLISLATVVRFYEVQQGSVISPVLANMTLDGLERMLRKMFPKTTTKGIAAKVNFVRYADDFIVTAASKELLEQQVKPRVEAFMKERGLALSDEKTCITHIEDGFDFLGQNVRKYKTGKQYKLLIKPAQKNVHAHLEKIRDIIKRNQTLSAGRLILMLNPIIRGWAHYHQHIVSADVFSSVDDAIYRRLRQWMKRRHPNKSNKWITKKYFKTHEGKNWVFYGEKDRQEYYLADTARVPIKRHTKIKSEANPYDPAWETSSTAVIACLSETCYNRSEAECR